MKQLRPEQGIESSTLREIVILGHLKKIQHPNIIRIRDVMTDREIKEKSSFFSRSVILDRAQQDLGHYLKKHADRPLEISTIQSFTAQILNGLQCIHENGYLHRCDSLIFLLVCFISFLKQGSENSKCAPPGWDSKDL